MDHEMGGSWVLTSIVHIIEPNRNLRTTAFPNLNVSLGPQRPAYKVFQKLELKH